MRQRQAAQGLQQKDRAERMAGRFGRPGDHEADSERCGDRQDRSIGHGYLQIRRSMDRHSFAEEYPKGRCS